MQSLSGDPLRETISGVFTERNVVVAASGYNLKEVLAIVDQIDFHNRDDIFTVGHVYEELLRRLGNENKMAGEFFTPRPVVRFVARVVQPRIGETVYDPAAGTCGFLSGAYAVLKDQVQMVEDERRLQFDVIVTNPPFGGTEGRHIQANFPVPANATELLFLEHVMKKLKLRDGARCGMVVPEGTLFRGGAFAEVKKQLLEQFNVHTVVSLPPGTFAPYSDVKTALIFFEWPGPTEEIFFYELPLPEGLKKFSKGSPIADAHFKAAWQA